MLVQADNKFLMRGSPFFVGEEAGRGRTQDTDLCDDYEEGNLEGDGNTEVLLGHAHHPGSGGHQQHHVVRAVA